MMLPNPTRKTGLREHLQAYEFLLLFLTPFNRATGMGNSAVCVVRSDDTKNIVFFVLAFGCA